MGKIVLLDDLTINKIAAGEVIERPASVVKELVENSIDAGADKITVEIKNGGISFIKITDNGKGFEADDMEIAFERHATSKLRSADELDEIKSMGFRGEALASVAAIAKVTLRSKTKDMTSGNEIIVEGGKVKSQIEAACQTGTIITVENLFYNTPVRYKFLKKDFTESGYIEDTISRIALSYPNISIKLINSGKTIVQTSGNGSIKDVIYGIYGKDVAENIIDINYEYEDITVSGVIGKPVISRSNRTNQIFFVNDRYIKDKTLSGAAEQGFKGFITIGKHGFLVLNLKMNPKDVDVNVHPAKLEVRFTDENKVFKAVYHAIRDGLGKTDLVIDTDSIDGIDKGKKADQEQDIEKVEKAKETSFRDLIKEEAEEKEEVVEAKEEKKEEKKVKEDSTTYSDDDFNNVIAKLNAIKAQLYNSTKVEEVKEEKEEKEEPEEVDEVEEVVEEKASEVVKIEKEDKDEEETVELKTLNIDDEDEEDEVLEKAKEIDEARSNADKDDKVFVKIEDDEDDDLNLLKIEEKEEAKEESEDEIIDDDNELAHTSDEEIKDEIEKIHENIELKKMSLEEIINKYKREEELESYKAEDDVTEESAEEEKEEVKEIAEAEETTETEEEKVVEEDKEEPATEEVKEEAENEEKVEEKSEEDEEVVLDKIEVKEEKVEEKVEEKEPVSDDEIDDQEIIKRIRELQRKNKEEGRENVSEDEFLKMYEEMFGLSAPKVKSDEEIEQEKKIDGSAQFKTIEGRNLTLFDDEKEKKPVYKIIGVAFRTYIIIELKNDLYLIDQHAAHERVLYEKVKANYFNNTMDKDSQLMLLPDVITLTNKEMAIYKENARIFEQAGFVIDEFGENTLKISGVPTIWFDLDTKEIFLETLDEINTVARTARQEIEERFLATIACKAAVKAHMDLSNNEISELLDSLLVLPNPFTCPHGRPTAIKLTNYDLEKKFSRKQ